MKKRYLAGLAVGMLLAGSMTTAEASLIAQDLFSSGDKLVTTDTMSNLQWLDLSLTTNQSPAQILSSNYVLQMGFRYATSSELTALYTQFLPINTPTFGDQSVLSGVISALGHTGFESQADFSGPRQNGYYGETTLGDKPYAVVEEYTFAWDNSIYSAVWVDPLLKANRAETGMGSYLVREVPPTPTPEPATMLLMGAGLAGFIGVRKRKK